MIGSPVRYPPGYLVDRTLPSPFLLSRLPPAVLYINMLRTGSEIRTPDLPIPSRRGYHYSKKTSA